MPVQNPYNPNYMSFDQYAKSQAYSGSSPTPDLTPQTPQQPQKFLGVTMTPNSPDKKFGRKVLEDAALLGYAIPVGIAQMITHPLEFIKSVPSALKETGQQLIDPEYYKAHPLLGVANILGVVQPIAGVAKSAVLKTAVVSATDVALNGLKVAGVDSAIAKTVLNPNLMRTAITEAAKSGNTAGIVEVVRSQFMKAGLKESVGTEIGTQVASHIDDIFAQQSKKLKTLNTILSPVKTAAEGLGVKIAPIGTKIFGEGEKTAVGKTFGDEAIKDSPEAYLNMEKWASAQVKELGLPDSVENRQRMLFEWQRTNPEWASLDSKGRIAHIENYIKQDKIIKQMQYTTGLDITATKALPINTVDAMVDTIKAYSKENPNITPEELLTVLQENFGYDIKNHMTELSQSIVQDKTVSGLTKAIEKLGNPDALINFTEMTPELKVLMKELEGTGYRAGYAPTSKPVSYISDAIENNKDITMKDLLTERTKFGRWWNNIGLSAGGVIEGAPEFTYRQNFTQAAIQELGAKYGGIIKAGKSRIPVENLFDWIDRKRGLIQDSRNAASFEVRTVFDVTKKDLIEAGFDANVASDIIAISKKSLRDIPSSVVGMGDKTINFLRSSNNGFGRFYDWYLKLAYKGRYDWSPFFSAQQFAETKLNMSMMLKNPRVAPGVALINNIGSWGASKLGRKIEQTIPYLSKTIKEPQLPEMALVKDELLSSLSQSMLDYTSSPDILNIMDAASGGIPKSSFELLKDKAAFRKSIQSRNLWYRVTGQSTVKLATQFNKGLAEKFGMTLDEALSSSIKDGKKVYNNPYIVNLMKESTQDLFHYKVGFLTSPLGKTMNIIWYPFRFQAKTIELGSKWLQSLPPVTRGFVMNNWVHFANWSDTEEGIEWRRKSQNLFYNILNYSAAYNQIGQSIEAVSKGRLFGGNTGIVGGVPFGVIYGIAQNLSLIKEDPDQFNPKTGRPYQKMTPKKIVSEEAFVDSLEELIISVLPSAPFYTLTGGAISGASVSNYAKNIISKVYEYGTGSDLNDYKKVPLDYSRFNN